MRKMRGMRGMRGMRKMRKRLLILNFEFCEKLPGGASAAGGFPSAGDWRWFPDRANFSRRILRKVARRSQRCRRVSLRRRLALVSRQSKLFKTNFELISPPAPPSSYSRHCTSTKYACRPQRSRVRVIFSISKLKGIEVVR